MSDMNINARSVPSNIPPALAGLQSALVSPTSHFSTPGANGEIVRQEHAGVIFLRELDPTGRHNLVAIDPDGGLVGRTFEPGSWAAIESWIRDRDGKANLYFSANEPKAGASNSSLDKHEIELIRCVYGDTDPRDGVAFANERERLTRLAAELLGGTTPPTFVIDSGGGIQPLWVLDAKLPAPGYLTAAEEQGRGIAVRIDGDRVQNINRFLRLPGTLNIPKASKRLRGQIERRARVSPPGRRWTLTEIAAEIKPVRASRTDDDARVSLVISEVDGSGFDCADTISDLDPELRARFDETRRENPALDRLWLGEAPKDSTGSGYRAKLAALLGRAGGFSASDYAQLAWVWPHAVQAGDDRETKLTARSLGRDWARIGQHADVAQHHFDASAVQSSERAVEEVAAQPDVAGVLPEKLQRIEPADIFGDADPVELSDPPPGSMPSILEQWAIDEARRKGVSVAFPAMAGLAVFAAAIGTSLRIRARLHDEWYEPGGLWVVLVADPGSAKSPIVNAAMRPLRLLDGEHFKQDKARHDLWAAKAKRLPKGVLTTEPEPKIRRCVVDDVTMESQIQIHAANPQGIMRAPDEFAGLLGSLGAYKKGAETDRTQVLRLFDGGSITNDRVGSGRREASSALMSILAGTQPDKLRTLTRDLGADGLLQRCLFIMDDGRRRSQLDVPPDRDAANAYGQAVRTLRTAGASSVTDVELSPGAYEVLMRAVAEIDAMRDLPGASKEWVGHVNKWGKILPRLMLIFHALEHIEIFDGVLIGAKVERATAEGAVRFARFVLRHSLRFYETYFGARAETSEARKIAGFILTKPDLIQINRRQVYDARTNLRGPENLRSLLSAMRELEHAGWVEPVESDHQGPRSWKINPTVHARFMDRAKREREERGLGRERIMRAGAAKDWLTDDSSDAPGASQAV